MKTLVLGLAVIAVAVLAVLPAGLDWGDDVLAFFRGSLPVVATIISIIMIFFGVLEIKDNGVRKKGKD